MQRGHVLDLRGKRAAPRHTAATACRTAPAARRVCVCLAPLPREHAHICPVFCACLVRVHWRGLGRAPWGAPLPGWRSNRPTLAQLPRLCTWRLRRLRCWLPGPWSPVWSGQRWSGQRWFRQMRSSLPSAPVVSACHLCCDQWVGLLLSRVAVCVCCSRCGVLCGGLVKLCSLVVANSPLTCTLGFLARNVQSSVYLGLPNTAAPGSAAGCGRVRIIKYCFLC